MTKLAEERVPLDAWTDSLSILTRDVSAAAASLLDRSINPHTAEWAAAAADASGFLDTSLSIAVLLGTSTAGKGPQLWGQAKQAGLQTRLCSPASEIRFHNVAEDGSAVPLTKEEFVELTMAPVQMADVYGWCKAELADFALAAAPCIAYEILTSPTHGHGAVRKGADFVARRLKEIGSHSAPADFWEVYSVLQKIS